MLPFFLFDKKLSDESLSFFLGNEKASFIGDVLDLINCNVNVFLAIVIAISILNFFKKRNSEKILNSNGNVYYNYYYVVFWIAATFLGYEKIQMAGLPLHLQYKLILSGLFSTIIPDVYDDHYDGTEKPDATIKLENFEEKTSSVNLLVIDTYNINLDELSAENQNLSTIIVRSDPTDGVRRINEALIGQVKKAMGEIQKNHFENVYVYSTANPKNNIKIVNSAFRFFGRSKGFKLYVMQKDSAVNGKYIEKYRIFI